jgi:hypothetical protein
VRRVSLKFQGASRSLDCLAALATLVTIRL